MNNDTPEFLPQPKDPVDRRIWKTLIWFCGHCTQVDIDKFKELMCIDDTPADAIKPCRYCGGQKRFQIVSPVSDHAWADCFCVKDRTTSLAAQSDVGEFLPRMMNEWCEAVADTWGQGSETHNVARDGVAIVVAAFRKPAPSLAALASIEVKS